MWFCALFGRCGFPIKKCVCLCVPRVPNWKKGIVPDAACRALGWLPKRTRIMEVIEFIYVYCTIISLCSHIAKKK